MHWLLVIWLLVGTVAVPVSAAERSAGGDEGGITASGVVSITTFNAVAHAGHLVSLAVVPDALCHPSEHPEGYARLENARGVLVPAIGRLTEHWPMVQTSACTPEKCPQIPTRDTLGPHGFVTMPLWVDGR